MNKIFIKEINFWTSLVSVFVLAIVTIFTSSLIYSSRQRSISPTGPDQAEAVANCVLSYSISTPTLTPIPTSTPTLVSTSTPTPVPTSTLTPTSAPIGQCLDTKIYGSTWNLLTSSQISALKATDQVYFCVRGGPTSASGSYDKARFTINGVLYPDTTLVRPGSVNEFCQNYVVPSGVYSFNVIAEIHHTTLGWIK